MLGVLTRSLACRFGMLGRSVPRFVSVNQTCRRPYFKQQNLEVADHVRKVDRIPAAYELIYYMEMQSILRTIGYLCPFMLITTAGLGVSALMELRAESQEVAKIEKHVVAWEDMPVVQALAASWAVLCLLGCMYFVHVKPIRIYHNREAKFYYVILQSFLPFRVRRIKVPEGAIKKVFPSADEDSYKAMMFKTDKQYLVLYKEFFQSPVHYFRLAGKPNGY